MVTISSYIFISIFKMEHFKAIKFTRGNEKKVLSSDTKISAGLEKNLKQSDHAPLTF